MKPLAPWLGVLVLGCTTLLAQSTQALRQSFHAPKQDVEQALKDINANQGGRLPFLEGFVGSINDPLANYQRAFYQYTVEVTQVSDSEVSVSVNAKISAWYEDKDKSKSGYRDLPSSGRLEQDLLARVASRLHEHAAEVAANRTPLVSPKLLGTEIAAPPETATTAPSQPEAPVAPSSPGSSSSFKNFGASRPLTPPSAAPEEDAHYQRLVQEDKSLREVIAAQQHPDNLVAVKDKHTAILSTPGEHGHVVMFADADDEFQLLKAEGDWIHVQISGLNRGWVRRSQVEILGNAKAQSASAPASAPASADELFRQTKEETSTFPGDWAPLRGKNVKIIWVQPNGKSTQKSRLNYTEAIFKKQAPQLKDGSGVEGVVVVFDAAEGGMAATTIAALRQWGAGSLSDAAFLKQCWFDPEDAFTTSAAR